MVVALALLGIDGRITGAADAPPGVSASALRSVYERTKTARGEADFTAIIEATRAATTAQLSSADAAYARRLLAWAYSRRAALREQPLREQHIHQQPGRNHPPQAPTPSQQSDREALALADYAEALQLDPAQAATLLSRGRLYIRQQRWADAADDLRAALRLAPEDAAVLRETAWLLACCPDEAFRDPVLAVSTAERARQLEATENFGVLDVLAAAYASAGDFEQARTTQRRAIVAARQTAALRVQELQQRLSLYEQQQPYRLAVPATAAAEHSTPPVDR
jgi:tetratricopeptide (TPR) repeat protein